MVDIDALKNSLLRREEGADRIPLWVVPPQRAEEMNAAADEVLECQAVLDKGDGNLVAEVLRGGGTFTEWDHYPKGDVYDRQTHSQYYYHAHPSELRTGEHGHFHTFLRVKGMPKAMQPAPMPTSVDRPLGKDALSHLIGISMDKAGNPIRLFTVNGWVTGESWYSAKDVLEMLDLFAITHAVPSWPTNRWVGAMIKLFRPQIEWLLAERDESVRLWLVGKVDPETPVYDDRKLEVTSVLDISVDAQVKLVRAAAI
jgi:hypothetical protein